MAAAGEEPGILGAHLRHSAGVGCLQTKLGGKALGGQSAEAGSEEKEGGAARKECGGVGHW